ncbi:MAG: NUDIX domain-containing protein [Candidatus Pacebacteria bacterium]|nr:NUDIX domain-containing protein [Candidatus Paceibacterota bacterium]
MIKQAGRLGLEQFLERGQLLTGPFNQIKVKFSPKEQELSEKILSMINLDWQKHLENYPSDFDGEMASIVRIDKNNEDIIIETRKSSFSAFFSLRKTRGDILDINNPVLDKDNCIPLSIGAVSVTTDDMLIVAIRGNTAFDEKVVTFLPGGYLDPTEDIDYDGDISVPHCIRRELQEEIGINDYQELTFLGVVHSSDASKQPLIAARLRLPISSKDIGSNLKSDPEIYEFHIIRNNIDDVAEFLKGKMIAIHDAWKIILHFTFQ